MFCYTVLPSWLNKPSKAKLLHNLCALIPHLDHVNIITCPTDAVFMPWSPWCSDATPIGHYDCFFHQETLAYCCTLAFRPWISRPVCPTDATNAHWSPTDSPCKTTVNAHCDVSPLLARMTVSNLCQLTSASCDVISKNRVNEYLLWFAITFALR